MDFTLFNDCNTLLFVTLGFFRSNFGNIFTNGNHGDVGNTTSGNRVDQVGVGKFVCFVPYGTGYNGGVDHNVHLKRRMFSFVTKVCVPLLGTRNFRYLLVEQRLL